MDTITDTTPGVTGGRRGFWGALWAGTRATLGALMGLAPHVMHHIGFLAGAALLTGLWGVTLLVDSRYQEGTTRRDVIETQEVHPGVQG